MGFHRTLPKDNDTFRRSIFNGDIYILPANDVTQKFVVQLQKTIKKAFHLDDLQNIHTLLHPDDFLHEYLTLRREMSQPAFGARDIEAVLERLCFATQPLVRDMLRLRIALHEGFLNPGAKSAYTIHRDTWYANPQSQINFWIPLFDVRKTQGFNFYPAFFNKAVKNSSDVFNYGDWRENVGFSNAKKPSGDALYPSISEEITEDHALSFECKAGDIVVFSAAHLHGNCQNTSGLSRFSIDFRVADLRDETGAPNVDNRSTGSVLQDYIPVIA